MDYPGIYYEADSLSNNTQRNYLWVLRIFLNLLILSSILSLYYSTYKSIGILNAVLSISIIAIAFLLFLYDFQGIWYSSRAVAESIKTITWRYVTKSDPFNNDENVDQQFIDRIEDILKMNHKFKENLRASYSSQKCISSEMSNIRGSILKERMDFYLVNRVEEQRDWYKRKSEFNRKRNGFFISIIILLTILLTVILFLQIGTNIKIQLPNGIVVSLITTLFTWVQTKRYKELISSYGLTAHEIGFIYTVASKVETEEEFSTFVMNTENAFSKEHTQWLARSDK